MATSIVETITPAKANQYLKTSIGNRNISKAVVNSYAVTMKRGEWMLNGESIVFDKEGHLINGHHRLHAIIQAEVPIETFVTRGVANEAFVTFDCGRHRTIGQLIGMQQVKNYNAVASAVNVAEALINGQKVGDNNSGKKNGRSNLSVMDNFNQDRDLYIWAGQTGYNIACRTRLLDSSIIGGSLYYLYKYCNYDKEFIIDFFEKITSWDTSDNEMLNILRKRLAKEKLSVTTKTPKRILFALIVKTWNYYVTGNIVKTLKFTEESEEYPRYIKNEVKGSSVSHN